MDAGTLTMYAALEQRSVFMSGTSHVTNKKRKYLEWFLCFVSVDKNPHRLDCHLGTIEELASVHVAKSTV